jgi:carbon-monoxide dehydrogenase large subunit
MALAEKVRAGVTLPDGSKATLDVTHVTDPVPGTYPNGCHVAEVEIDPETGVTQVVKYSGVNDFGTVINPMLVEGQTHGGVMQGIGQALMESAVYDADGQLLTGSFMDYAMPRAKNAVNFDIASHEVPTQTNPVGAKGCGEAGVSASLPTVMSAVIDALSDYGIRHIEMPVTPQRLWQAIQDSRHHRPA